MSIFVVFAVIGVTIFLIAVTFRPPETPFQAKGGPDRRDPTEGRYGGVLALLVLVLIALTSLRKRMTVEPVSGTSDVSPTSNVSSPAASGSGSKEVADQGTAGWPWIRWALTVLATAVFLSGCALWIFWNALVAPDSPETPFQEAIGSAYIGSAAAGLAFGVLFGYWFGSVLFRQPGSKATYPEIAVGVVMLVLLLLGLAGQNVISQAFSRLTSVEVGGAKLGFEAATVPKSIGPAQANSPAGRANRAGPGQSQGLVITQLLADVEHAKPGQISRDGRYSKLIARVNGYSGTPDVALPFDNAAKEFGATLAPLFLCMTSFYARTGDDQRLWELLAPIAYGMRRFALTAAPQGSANQAADWESAFWSAVDAMRNERPNRDQALDPDLNDGDEHDCVALLTLGPKDRADYLKPLRTDSWRRSPYLQFVVAGLLAYGHQYGAAVFTLEQAVAHNLSPAGTGGVFDAKATSAIALTLSIRLRGAILTYMEEWIHGLNVVQPVEILTKYQLRNLDSQIESFETIWRMEKFSEITDLAYTADNKLPDSKFYAGPSTSKSCNTPKDLIGDPNDWTDMLILSRSYISTKLNWITVALDQPDYFHNYKHQANKYITDLLKINLNCLSLIDTAEAKDLRMADINEAYARVTYANYIGTQKIQDLTSDEAKAENLKLALESVRSAEARLTPYTSKETPVLPLKEPLSPDPLQQTHDNLKALELSIETSISLLSK